MSFSEVTGFFQSLFLLFVFILWSQCHKVVVGDPQDTGEALDSFLKTQREASHF